MFKINLKIISVILILSLSLVPQTSRSLTLSHLEKILEFLYLLVNRCSLSLYLLPNQTRIGLVYSLFVLLHMIGHIRIEPWLAWLLCIRKLALRIGSLSLPVTLWRFVVRRRHGASTTTNSHHITSNLIWRPCTSGTSLWVIPRIRSPYNSLLSLLLEFLSILLGPSPRIWLRLGWSWCETISVRGTCDGWLSSYSVGLLARSCSICLVSDWRIFWLSHSTRWWI